MGPKQSEVVQPKHPPQPTSPEIVVNGGDSIPPVSGTEVVHPPMLTGGKSGFASTGLIAGVVVVAGLVAVGAGVGIFFAVDRLNDSDVVVEWPDTKFATSERGCRDSAGNWRNMERREGQSGRYEGYYLMGSAVGLGDANGIITTDICVHEGESYYMVEWTDGVTSYSDMSRDHGNRIVELYTQDTAYRVFDVKDTESYCMIETIQSTVFDNPISLALNRKSQFDQVSQLLDSLSDVDALRDRISYIITYVPPDVNDPNDDSGNPGSYYTGSYGPANPGYTGGYVGYPGLQGAGGMNLQDINQIAAYLADNYPHYTHDETVQFFLDQLEANPDFFGPVGRNRRSSGITFTTDTVYVITGQVESNADLQQLKDHYIDEVCTNSSMFYFIEKSSDNSVPSDCTMRYYFYYSDTIGQLDDNSLSRRKRESPPMYYPIYRETPVDVVQNDAYDNNSTTNNDNELVQLLNDESALADVASAIGDFRNNFVIPTETMALSVMFQVEKEFGALLHNVNFC